MKLNPVEKRTFWLHMLFSFVEGLTRGILALNAYVLLRSLDGSNQQVGYLFTITWGIMLLTVFFSILARNTKNIKKLLVIMAFVTRGPLLLFAFFPLFITSYPNLELAHNLFLIIFLFYFFSQPFFMPIINLVLKTNYSKDKFGRLFGYSNMVRNGMTLLGTFIFAVLLEGDYQAYTVVYPIIGLVGILSIYLFNLIDFSTYNPIISGTFFRKLSVSIGKLWEILIKNKPYRDFEIGFIFYGIAFMMTDSVVKIFMEDYLKLDYITISVYENLRWIFAICLTPIFSLWVDRIDPRKFGIFTFLSLALYLFFMGLTQYLDQTVSIAGYDLHITIIISIFFFGVFTATMGILWSIGSSYFCKADEAADYQAVHMSLTGIRALFFPIIGIAVYEQFSYSINFGFGIAFLIIGILAFYISMKRYAVE